MQLYESIFHRHSVRSYHESPLPEPELSEIKGFLDDRPRFYPAIPSEVTLVEDGAGLQRNISGIIADYGKVRSPHYLVISSEEEDGHLVDIGYSLEYLVLQLTRMGVGTCWIGKGFKGKGLREFVDLPSAQEARALIAFGPPGPDEELARIEEPHRKELGHFLPHKRESQLDEKERKLIDGLRRAPSALNGQPWRVSLEGETVRLFIEIRSKITRALVGNMLTMNKIDGGIGLSHLEIAGRNLWSNCSLERGADVSADGMEYIGSLELS